MRIAYLVVAEARLSDSERATIDRARRLAPDHTVEVVELLPGGGAGDDEPHGESVLVPRRWDRRFDERCDRAIRTRLPGVEADVAVTTSPGMLAAAAQFLPPGTSLLHEDHGAVLGDELPEALLAFAPRAGAIAALTEAHASLLRDRLGERAPLVRSVPLPAPGPHRPRSLLDQPVVVTAGRLDGDRQHAHLVRAFGAVAEEIPEWRLRIFGTGPRRAALRALGRRLGLYDRLELPGDADDLPAEWAAAGIAALTSRREAFPTMLLDAFAAGVPVVAYDCPTGPAELFQHGTHGLLVPPDDERALAQQLLRLARDPDLRHRIGTAGRDSLQRYGERTVLRQLTDLLREVTAGRGADPTAGPHAVAPDVPNDLTPAHARRRLLSAVADALAGTDGWFVLPARGELPPTVVLPDDRRTRLLTTLARADLPPWASAAVTSEDHWHVRRGPVEGICRAAAAEAVRGLTLEPWPERDGRPTHLAHASGIRLQFWVRDRDGALHAPPGPGRFADTVRPADVGSGVEVEGVPVPSPGELAGPFADECPFPVDVVYTWVDDEDPGWHARKKAALEAATGGPAARAASGEARFRNRDELRYSLRSVHAHAPWVRHVYLVTAGQRPAWLVDHPRITVVDHSEILPADALPTFNSHAIETALHRVPGLSEQFLYLNDDFFLGRPATPEQFFSPGGSFAVFAGERPIGIRGTDDRPYVEAAHNNRRLLQERFGVTITQHVAHAPYPHRRSTLEAVVADFPDAVHRTARSRFRSSDDVSLLSSLAQHHGLMTGAAYPGRIDYTFVDTSRPNVEARFRELLGRGHTTFCIGDHHDYALPHETVERLLLEFLEEYFPVRAPWEA